MGLYRPKTVVSKYYAILFSLPGWRILATLMLITALTIIVYMGYKAIPLLLNSLLIIAVLKGYSIIWRKTVFHKLKRIVGLALATLVYMAVFTVLTNNIEVVLASSATLTITVILGLDGTSASRYLISIIPQLVTLCIAGFLLHIDMDVVKGLVALFIVIVLDMLIYQVMSRHRINGFRSPDLGTLFLRNWLDKHKDIEMVFEKLGVDSNIDSRILEMGDLLIIYTDLHYGPFSNTGSSELPALLVNTFGNLGYKLMTLHGFGSHDRNVVSSRLVDEYIRKLLDSVISSDKSRIKYHGSFKVSGLNGWEALSLVFDKSTLVFVSRTDKGIDDLPYDLQVKYASISKRRGLGDLLLIDSHNWEKEAKLDIESLDDLLSNVVKHVEKYKKRPPVDVLFKYSCFKTKAAGLINGDVCIVIIGGDGYEKVGLVYLRGNNMKPGVRDIIVNIVHRCMELDYVEVFTNDEHTETGVRSFITYIPVHDSPDLLRSIEDKCAELASSDHKRGAYYYGVRTSMKLMGPSAIWMEELLKKSYKEAALLLVSYVFATPVFLSLVL
ncbi:MAG: DUF2070 family protein [Desulfurococcaceae archaeon]